MPKRRANGEGNIRKRKDGRWEDVYKRQEYHMNALHHAGTQPMFFQFRLVFLLHTAALEQLVVKLLDLQHRQLFQLHAAKLWNDVMVDGIVIEFFGRISHLWFDVNGVPQLQPLFERITSSLHRIELLAVLNGCLFYTSSSLTAAPAHMPLPFPADRRIRRRANRLP